LQNIEIAAIRKILAHKSCFLNLCKKVRHITYYIFDNETENKILKFWKIGISISQAAESESKGFST